MSKYKYIILISVIAILVLLVMVVNSRLMNDEEEVQEVNEVGEENETVASDEWERKHYSRNEFIQEHKDLSQEDREFINEEYEPVDRFSSLVSSTEDVKYFLIDSKSQGRLDFYTLDSDTGELDNFLNLNRDEIKSVSDNDHEMNFDYYLEDLQGNQLMIFKKDEMDSPGPCFSSWVYVYKNPVEKRSIDKCLEAMSSPLISEHVSKAQLEENCKVRVNTRVLYFLKLDSLGKGLDFYEVPEEKYEQEKKEEEECLESHKTR